MLHLDFNSCVCVRECVLRAILHLIQSSTFLQHLSPLSGNLNYLYRYVYVHIYLTKRHVFLQHCF